MKTVLITGSEGFTGRNLRAHLDRMTNLEVLGFDRDDPIVALAERASKADFIFHLAGVNRPKDPVEFDNGNRGLTGKLVEILVSSGRRIPLLVSSSIQAERDNPYGKSKLGAEEVVRSYSARTGAQVFLFRLPNVFGKWCRPNYNSVVATWCYNAAHDLPMRIDDPATELKLVYIDDVCNAFLEAFDGRAILDAEGFCHVSTVYSKALGGIACLLESFKASRKSLVMPSLEDDFARRLYATWLSYIPEAEFGYPLEMKRDDRGWLAEFIKSPAFGQLFISTTNPGVTRGNHWHHTKVEKFLVVAGQASIRLRKIDGDHSVEYMVSGDELRVVDIPVGYTHSITNIGDDELVTLFWADEIFNPLAQDTYSLEV